MWVNQLLEMCYGHVRTVQCVWTFFSGGVLCVHCYMTECLAASGTKGGVQGQDGGGVGAVSEVHERRVACK